MNKQSALRFEKVSFSFTNLPILENVNFNVKNGQFVSILGPSGSGKSTIFRLITGLEQPSSGEIYIEEEQMQARLGQVGYMPQRDLLLPWRRIVENAALPLEIQGVSPKIAEQRVLPLLKEFGLEGFENHYPNECSGGMRQRVSFLRAIMGGNNLLLLDEPFSALDSITRLNMQEWLLDTWSKWKKTILFITHDVEEAIFLSDRLLIMNSQQPVQVLQEIEVPLSRPRAIADLAIPEVVKLKQGLLDELRSKVRV